MSYFVNRYKELAEKLVQLLKSQFVLLSRLSKQEIRGTEQNRVWSFSLCFYINFFPSMNSSTDESRL